MDPLTPRPPAAQPGVALRQFSAMLLASLALYAASAGLLAAPCWAVLLLGVLCALPIGLALQESALYNRRAWLLGASQPDSVLRQLLWRGKFTAIRSAVVALVVALLLLAAVSLLSAAHWAVLFVDTLVLTLLYGRYRSRLAREVPPANLDIAVRAWPLLLTNVGLIGLVFFVLDYALLGAPDTRLLDWYPLLTAAFNTQREQAGCLGAGYVLGFLAALEQLSWHWAQVIIPQLPELWMRPLAWVLFLVRFGLVAWFYTRLLIGITLLVQVRSRPVQTLLGGGLVARTFLLTLLVLAALSTLVAIRLRDFAPQDLPVPAAILARFDPCHGDPEPPGRVRADLDLAQAEEWQRISRQVEADIDQQVDRLFANAAAGVDRYLDWYFTLAGEYERLGAALTGDFAQLMAAQIEQELFTATPFPAQVEAIRDQALADTTAGLVQQSAAVAGQLTAWAAAGPCRRETLDLNPLAQFNRDSTRMTAAVVTGATAGAVAVSVLAKKVAAKVAAKLATKGAAVATALLAKTAAKQGLTVGAAFLTGTTLCAPTGLVAVLCGIGAGGIVWLTTDKVLIEIDEALSRQEMRAELLAALAAEQDALKEALKQQHRAVMAQFGDALQTTLNQTFLPVRDGQ